MYDISAKGSTSQTVLFGSQRWVVIQAYCLRQGGFPVTVQMTTKLSEPLRKGSLLSV